MKGVFFLFTFAVILIFGYQPIATEIHSTATNGTLTNSTWEMLDILFPYFWALIAIGVVSTAIYVLYQEV